MEDKKKNEVINAKELEQVAGGFIPGENWYQDEQGNWVEVCDGIKVVRNDIDPKRRYDYEVL